ncbi:MAG: GntR family transcriptional regulator [Chloroflexota bacterium]|nr:GntR family transcriptional regulator [Chloroflexota bacterium]
MISFRIDPHSGSPPYFQLVQQVKDALRLGILQVGDRLPTVREAAASATINPNTVMKAYRELELEGLVISRPGAGTFIQRTLAGPSLKSHESLRRSLRRWLNEARAAGLDDDSIEALVHDTMKREETGIA